MISVRYIVHTIFLKHSLSPVKNKFKRCVYSLQLNDQAFSISGFQRVRKYIIRIRIKGIRDFSVLPVFRAIFYGLRYFAILNGKIYTGMDALVYRLLKCIYKMNLTIFLAI